MTFDPNIPQNTPSPAKIVSKIQTNFSQYATVFGNDHIAMNSTGQGAHSDVIFENQASDPIVNNTFDVLYCKQATAFSGTFKQLFLRIPQFLPNSTQNNPQQLTFNKVSTAGPDFFQTFMPGGYIFYFGFITDVSNPVPATITLTPAPSGIVSAIATANNMTTSGTPIPVDVSVTVLSNTQFQINSTLAVAPYRFSWMAVARQ